MTKYFLSFLFFVIASLPAQSQALKGKKLLKESTFLIEQGKEREAISLLSKNFSKEDKSYDLVGLELAKHLTNAKLLDSANYFLSISESHEKSKVVEEMASQRLLLDAEIEKYKIEVLSGWKEFDNAKFAMANEHFSTALSFDLGNYEAYLGKAEILFNEGSNVESINGLKESLTKFYPNNNEKAHVYEHLAEVNLTQRNTLAVIKACETGMELDPENHLLYFYKGKAMYFERRFMDADNLLANYLRFEPENAEAWYLRGECFYNLNTYEKAITNFNKSIAIDSTNTDAFSSRGRSYFELKKYDLAIADFDYLNQIFPGNFYAINAQGVCEFYAGDYPSAVTHFEKACALNPSEYYKFNLVNAYTKNGQNDKAIEICNELGEKNRGSVKYNIIHCQVLVNKKDFSSAEKWLDESMKLNPYVLEYLQLGEIIYKETGKVGKSKNSKSFISNFNDYPRNMDLIF